MKDLNVVKNAMQEQEREGEFYLRYLRNSRDGWERRLRELEAEIMRLEEKEDL